MPTCTSTSSYDCISHLLYQVEIQNTLYSSEGLLVVLTGPTSQTRLHETSQRITAPLWIRLVSLCIQISLVFVMACWYEFIYLGDCEPNVLLKTNYIMAPQLTKNRLKLQSWHKTGILSTRRSGPKVESDSKTL